MTFTETMLPALAQAALGDAHRTSLRAPNKFTQVVTEVDLGATPYRRIDVMDGLREALGEKEPLPDPNDEASLPWYLAACRRVGVEVHLPHTLPRVLDGLIGALLEPQCVAPTFLINHPTCLSPLSRPHSTRPGLTERFELFINGAEYVNAYSELNDPAEQRRRMEAQARALNAGDEEAQPVDAEFCQALQYGLPPTAGWGLGIDRLVMLLAGQTHIRDVLMFPVMKPQTPQPHKLQHSQPQPQQPVTPELATPVVAKRS
jgi:lysyl-tRNA synthetase class 2